VSSLKTDLSTHEIAFEAFGVRVGVSVSHATEINNLQEILPPGWRRCSTSRVQKRFGIRPDATGSTYRLTRDGELFTKGLELSLALAILESQVRAYIALHAPDKIFVHAGAVAHAGRAILLPGMSFAGKTTLVAALVRAGAIYYSDEYAPLDEHGLVHPYARSLAIRDDNLRQVAHDVASLGGTAGQEPLPVGAVVVTSYRAGAAWSPRILKPGEGVLALLGNTVPAQTRPAQALRHLARAVGGDTVLMQSARDDADALAPRLLADLAR